METIRSKDGTMIAFQRSGTGPPLVLVHGTTADHTRWAPILPAFEQHFTVYALDRRGRGGSGDAEPYAIEQEFEDIVALVDSIEDPVFLLGHSYGALCSLEVVRRTAHLRKLVLYEPPIPTGIEIYPPEVVTRIQALLDAGDREGAVTIFMQDIAHVPSHEMEILRSAPNWPARLAAAYTIPREMRGSNEYVFESARFSGLTIPTLLLLGGDSPAFFKAGIEAVHAALLDSRVVVMPGQQHTAMNTAPELFTREVLQFLTQESQIARL
ncbi:MAG TPA: alpha/beta hydrolase [Ktedonobacteraceae bacterium]|nr:alpha/beta hydrolase [Ktedonobacteraceae bacterium]